MISANFRSWFNRPEHADVLLRLRVEAEPAACVQQPDTADATLGTSRKRLREEQGADTLAPGPGSSDAASAGQHAATEGTLKQVQDVKTFCAHAVLLAGQSKWFEAALSESWQQSGGNKHLGTSEGAANGMSASARRELTVHVQSDEVEGMEMLLRLMYSHDLPDPTAENIALFLTCLRLADRLDSSCLVDMLLKHINGTPVSLFMLQHVCNAPPGITERPAYKQLLDSCTSLVVKQYGHVPAVNKSKQLMQEFCSLPFAAVLAWAKSDKLRVQSENCVVYLLSVWVEAAKEEGGQGVSSEQLEQLAQQVRVLHLGPTYLHQVLSQLGWFEGCSSTMKWLPPLMTLWCWKACDSSAVDWAELGHPDSGTWQGPKQWVAKPRKQYFMTDEDRTLKWEVGGEELQQLYEGKQQVSPNTLYVNGLHMQLLIDSEPACDAVALGLYYCMGLDQLNGIISPWPESATAVVGPAKLRLVGGPEVQCSSGARVGIDGCGTYDMLDRSAPTMRELLAPYLRDGKLHLEASFTYADRLTAQT